MTAVTIVGAGMGGFSAAVTAAALGLDVTLVEKGEEFGGAAAFSGGQVWVGANHVEAREDVPDSVDEVLQYVAALAAKDPTLFDEDRAREWVKAGRRAAEWFERRQVVRWTIIPGYSDYYWPDVEGARPFGRYLTGDAFDGTQLGSWRPRFREGPHFPVGLTYAEVFDLGGTMSRGQRFTTLLEARRAADIMTFGRGTVAAFAAAARGAGVRMLLATRAAALNETGGAVTGVDVVGPDGPAMLPGPVILATGSHDWNPETSKRVTGLDPDDSGSLAPTTLEGDVFTFAAGVGAAIGAIPAWAAPVVPGYALAAPVFDGDPAYRACAESCLPHSFIVNRAGERFCDDSFHPAIVDAATRLDDGQRPNVPMYLVWDSFHHHRYGLGATAPGAPYPSGLVTTAPTLTELAQRLGIDPAALETTAAAFNGPAREGRDPVYGRGTKSVIRRFRGDLTYEPNPIIGPVEEPPYFGMRLRLVNTGIASAGVMTTDNARVVHEDGTPIPGLYAVGECALRNTGGVGYNSGYSLGRAMTFGWIAAHHVAGKRY